MIDQAIPRYCIAEKIGEGGMGVVYKAEDTRLRRLVALKFLTERAAQDEESRKRFLQEARAAAALSHPNICTVYEIDENLGFLAMEYVEGETVEERRNRRPLAIEEVLDLAIQTSEGLQAAHETGIVHRDIKSSNLMVTAKGRVKIMDFGLARLAGRTRLTRSGSSPGTPAYMAPEVYQGERADERSDIWSLGVVLYEMIAGRVPFEGDFEAAILYGVLHEDPEPLNALRVCVPPELERVVAKALAKDPCLRYQRVDELAADLKTLRAALVSQAGSSPAQAPAANTPSAETPSAKTRGWKQAAIAAALLAIATTGLWLWREQDRNAREKAIQQVETLANSGEMMEAYRAARVLEKRNLGDSAMDRVWNAVGGSPRQIATDPPGAEIYVRDYLKPDSEWIHLGQSPLQEVRLPFLFMSLRAQKKGYADAGWAVYPFMPTVKLTPLESTPAGMVYVRGEGKLDQPFPLDDFWLDRYETTNAQYKKFVDAGGYSDRKFWKQPFVEGTRTLSWEEGMSKFRDATGRPGPANWELGSYPEGAANLPVTGVSWFEAAAYAEFMAKELPTVYHWQQAALYMPISSDVISLSNFAGKGPAAPGTYRGASFFGSYDMAGNVKEWCWNAQEERRYILGGAWSEPSYMLAQTDARSPFEREETFGFRCALYRHPVPENVKAPITRKVRDYSLEKPVSEEQYRAYTSLYTYDRTPLNEKIEDVDDSNPAWRREKITLDAAYGNERLIAYLYLPKKAAARYQTVVHFPAVFALAQDQIDSFSLYWVNYFVQSGRALLYPIYKGTYERRPKAPLQGPLAWRDQTFQWCKDLGRSLDYLETRTDIDRSKLAFHGMSMGSSAALPCLAVEDRFAAAILLEGGLSAGEVPPESDPFNFAPRIRIPTLMINGKDDFIYPVKQLQLPLYRLLAAGRENKRHVLFDGGHAVPRNLLVKESLDWLDGYLGPVIGAP